MLILDTPTINQHSEELTSPTRLTTNYTPKSTKTYAEEKPQLKDEDIFEFLNAPIQQAKEQKMLERKLRKQPEPIPKTPEVDTVADNSSSSVSNNDSASQPQTIDNNNNNENKEEDTVVGTNPSEQLVVSDNKALEESNVNKQNVGTITDLTFKEEEIEKLQDENEQLALENKLYNYFILYWC